MHADRWQRVESLFEQTLALPPEERDAFLTGACGGDTELRAAVMAMLEADPLADTFFDELGERAVSPALEALLAGPDALLGRRVGPFRVEAVLGHGGMGTVYRAERADGAFEQTVALKVVRGDLSPTLRVRFLAERRILARLEHPAIARLIDGGLTATGQPWLAMEYVEGEAITTYADRRRLGVDERLALFGAVCEAVGFAHGRLVVHRDLKPSNILVTPQGQVKLLDFGIAKLLADDEAASETPLTRTGAGPHTPEYAAPEQVRGESVSVATDVYALGVLLYELLTGRRPYRLPSRLRREVERAILEAEPTRPSAAVLAGDPTRETTPEALSAVRQADPEALRRRLTGDLDVILLTALRKEPERRYASVGAFADDVRLHLAGRPVAARADSPGYRAARFAQRHRTVLAAAALAFVALLGGLTAALIQANRAEREAERAHLEAATAIAVSDFLVGLFEASDPNEARGDSVLVREVLASGVARLGQELVDHPEQRARMLFTLGSVYRNLGLLDRADSLMVEALALRTAALGPGHAAVGETLQGLGNLRVGQGRYDEGIAELEQALRILRAAHPGDHAETAATLNGLGYALTLRGDHDDARPILEEAYAMEQRLSGGAPSPGFAVAADHLAILYYHLQDFEGAIPYMTEALAMQRALRGDQPHPSLAIAIDNLASMLLALQRFDEAEPLVREAVAMQRALRGDEPHPSLAVSLNNLGVLLLTTERLDEAEAAHRESLALKEVLYGPDHPSTGITLSWLARVARERAHYDEAERLFTQAVRIAEGAYPPGHGNWGGPVRELAGMLSRLDRWEEAERLYLHAYERTLEHFGEEHVYTRTALRPLAGFYEAWGRADEAERFAQLAAAP